MFFIADFHIHSKYSRATSKDMDIPHLSEMASLKGIHLIGTGDFTHPLWLNHLRSVLEVEGDGLLKYDDTLFVLTAEVSNIFLVNDRVRKVHNVIFAPDFAAAEKISNRLQRYGDLFVDGRPTLKMSCQELIELVMGVNEEVFVVPAHIWTPWFSLFGDKSGFDSIEDCFGRYVRYIYALETGLSSDPAMNWRLSNLDRFCLISNSDAHSPPNLGREVNVFASRVSYQEIRDILKSKDKKKFLFTVEFFPEEGKYHYDGHRRCGISLSPSETKAENYRCPKCRQRLTIGVMHRIEELADRPEGFVPPTSIPFKRVVPLREIIAEALGQGVETQKVREKYIEMVKRLGGEFKILLEISDEDLSRLILPRVAQGIKRVRQGQVKIECGYDGVYGKVSIFEDEEKKSSGQLNLFC